MRMLPIIILNFTYIFFIQKHKEAVSLLLDAIIHITIIMKICQATQAMLH